MPTWGTNTVQEIDVHGLLTDEAVRKTEQECRRLLRAGGSILRVITGKGNHSKDGKSKLRPAIQGSMEQHGFECTVDPKNTGVLILQWQGQ